MTPLSGSPSTLTVIHMGNVNVRAMPVNPHAARYLPSTASEVEIGSVIKISIVPVLRSSAHNRMAMAGTSMRYSHG